MQLISMSLKDFILESASDSPAPGGGSVSAAAGALAAALGSMVFNLTDGKKKYMELEQETRDKVEAEYKKIKELIDKLIVLVDKDTEAFNSFMAALKMPKASDEEKAARKEAMNKAAEVSLKVPLETAETVLEVMQALPLIAEHGNKNAISDAGVAAELGRAAVNGAILNVRINLPSLADETLKEESAKRVEEIKKSAEELYGCIMHLVEAKL